MLTLDFAVSNLVASTADKERIRWCLRARPCLAIRIPFHIEAYEPDVVHRWMSGSKDRLIRVAVEENAGNLAWIRLQGNYL